MRDFFHGFAAGRSIQAVRATTPSERNRSAQLFKNGPLPSSVPSFAVDTRACPVFRANGDAA